MNGGKLMLSYNEFTQKMKDEVQVTKVPTIIYVTDGKVKKGNIITRLDDNLFEKGDFQQLLDINDL